MIREIVFDIETTGLDFDKDRIVEIAAIEIIDLKPTGKIYHSYFDPKVQVPSEATAIHGLDNTFLRGFKTLAKTVQPFIDFVGDSRLVAHNGLGFDKKMLDREFDRIERPRLTNEIVDTLELSKKLKPGGRHSLDTMARHFGVSLAKRVKHGALIDCEILADVYLHLCGGKQGKMDLTVVHPKLDAGMQTVFAAPQRPSALPSLLTFDTEMAHSAMVESIANALWNQYDVSPGEEDITF